MSKTGDKTKQKARFVPRLLAITPPESRPDLSLPRQWRQMLGECSMHLAVLLRKPNQGMHETLCFFESFLAACRDEGLRVLTSTSVNDRSFGKDDEESPAENLQKQGICGLQLRGDPDFEQLSAERTFWGEDLIIGRSSHSEPSSNAALEETRVDYSCFAPVFPPFTKQSNRHKVAAGLDQMARWVSPKRHLLALGGIDPPRARRCLEHGAQGIAGIRLFFGPQAERSQNLPALAEALQCFLDPNIPKTPS